MSGMRALFQLGLSATLAASMAMGQAALGAPLQVGAGPVQATALPSAGRATVVEGAAGSRAGDGVSENPEARLAKRIDFGLRARRVAEALLDARAGVKGYPKSALLRLRLAQAHLCQAVQDDSALAESLQTVRFAPAVQRAVGFFDQLKKEPRLHKPGPDAAEREQEWAELERVLTGPTIADYEAKARTTLAQLGASLDKRNQSIADALDDLAEARKLGEDSTELELTDLWARLVAVLDRRGLAELQGLVRPSGSAPAASPESPILHARVVTLQRSFGRFDAMTRETVLKVAYALAQARPGDPVALAGAADVIGVGDAIGPAPSPLTAYIRKTLDRSFVAAADKTGPDATAASAEAAAQLYRQARDSKNPDVVARPFAVMLQLYRQAEAVDSGRSLPFLRLRLYLLERVFQPSSAAALLADIERHQPHNAVVPLERAREAVVFRADLAQGLAECREAARRSEFSRSCLVAVPPPLRMVLKFHPGLRKVVDDSWPHYNGLITTIWRAQSQQHATPSRIEMLLLRLHLAGLMCQAEDYDDQAFGINQKTLALLDLADLGDGLSPEQRAVIQLQTEAHQRAFAAFPRATHSLMISRHGVTSYVYPQLDRLPIGNEGPTMIAFPAGNLALMPDLRRVPTAHPVPDQEPGAAARH